MTQMMHGVTKGGKAVPIRVDDEGRVVVVVETQGPEQAAAPDKPDGLMARIYKRLKQK